MKKKVLTILIIILALISFLYFSNNYLSTSFYEVTSNEIPKNFNNYKIVQISDLHSKYFGKKQSYLISKINKINPDIIVFTGDMYDGNRDENISCIKPAIDLINELSKNYPIYYVTGNHEYDNKFHKEFQNSIKHKQNVFYLSEDVIEIKKDNESIFLTGIDDVSFYSTKDISFYRTLLNLSDKANKGFNILLSHRPYEIKKLLSKTNYDLILSGHNHGGQIAIPFILPNGIYSPSETFFPKYTKGIHQIGKNQLILSRGLGNSRFPFRVFNPPEIVTIMLKSSE